MDSEPKYQGHHERWSYNLISKILKENNYRKSSIAHEIRQARKEKGRRSYKHVEWSK